MLIKTHSHVLSLPPSLPPSLSLPLSLSLSPSFFLSLSHLSFLSLPPFSLHLSLIHSIVYTVPGVKVRKWAVVLATVVVWKHSPPTQHTNKQVSGNWLIDHNRQTSTAAQLQKTIARKKSTTAPRKRAHCRSNVSPPLHIHTCYAISRTVVVYIKCHLSAVAYYYHIYHNTQTVHSAHTTSVTCVSIVLLP